MCERYLLMALLVPINEACDAIDNQYPVFSPLMTRGNGSGLFCVFEPGILPYYLIGEVLNTGQQAKVFTLKELKNSRERVRKRCWTVLKLRDYPINLVEISSGGEQNA